MIIMIMTLMLTRSTMLTSSAIGQLSSFFYLVTSGLQNSFTIKLATACLIAKNNTRINSQQVKSGSKGGI
jgi:hypothetical protein